MATPTAVALEQAELEMKQLKYERSRQDKSNSNLNMELKMRYDLLNQLKQKELQNDSELGKIKELQKLVDKYS